MGASALASVCLLMGLSVAHQEAVIPASADRGTYLGILFGPNTSAPLEANPAPPPGGVVVTQVLPDSPAAKAGLHRNDLLQRYGDQAVTSCEQLARLIQADTPGRVVTLQVRRAGRPLNLAAKLTVGPALRLAGEARQKGGDAPAVGKAGLGAEAPALSAQIEPLGDGRLRVDLQYYLEGTGRLRSRTLTGTLVELARQIDQMPRDERRLGQVLLERLEQLNLTPARPRP